ncbi:MAG: hypothetical protein H6833_07650 [Planctomycetes bacterium]|nr:hypothetical protein [Planctomycetota bacterium]
MTPSLRVLIAALTFCTFSPRLIAQDPDPPSVAELVALAPRLSLRETDLSSFRVEGALILNRSPLRFTVLAARPDHAVVIHDGDSPFLVGCGGHAMLYDPVASRVEMYEGRSSFTLRIQPEDPDDPDSEMTLEVGFALGSRKNETEGESQSAATDIDLRSMMQFLANEGTLRMETVSPGLYRLIGVSDERETRVTAIVEPQRSKGAYRSLELAQPDEEGTFQPMIRFDEIVVGGTIPKQRFVFPEVALRESGLEVEEPSLSGPSFPLSIMQLARGLLARFAIHEGPNSPCARAVEKLMQTKLDWPRIAKRDERARSILRRVFKAQMGPFDRVETKKDE